eukprot:6179792-Pleurochrysis_carterae.AAC.1
MLQARYKESSRLGTVSKLERKPVVYSARRAQKKLQQDSGNIGRTSLGFQKREATRITKP